MWLVEKQQIVKFNYHAVVQIPHPLYNNKTGNDFADNFCL